MRKLKHSKYRNTGLIFELLSRKLVQETLSGTQLKALRIITKHFSPSTPLAQELKLYSALVESRIDSQLVEKVVETVEKVYDKLDHKFLDEARYRLVRDIKNSYGLDEFFAARTANYTKLAAAYKFLTYRPEDNPLQYVENRVALVEMISREETEKSSQSLTEWQQQDPEIRKLGFSLAIKNFNLKYKDLLPKQKELLKEYIMQDPASDRLKAYVNKLVDEAVGDIRAKLPLISDVTLKVKLTEGISLVESVKETPVLRDNHLNAVLKLCQLQDNVSHIIKGQ